VEQEQRQPPTERQLHYFPFPHGLAESNDPKQYHTLAACFLPAFEREYLYNLVHFGFFPNRLPILPDQTWDDLTTAGGGYHEKEVQQQILRDADATAERILAITGGQTPLVMEVDYSAWPFLPYFQVGSTCFWYCSDCDEYYHGTMNAAIKRGRWEAMVRRQNDINHIRQTSDILSDASDGVIEEILDPMLDEYTENGNLITYTIQKDEDGTYSVISPDGVVMSSGNDLEMAEQEAACLSDADDEFNNCGDDDDEI
jgi:hypothetical protein